LLPARSARADFGLRIFNPDGSEAEISGNGLRIFARWLRDHAGAPRSFTVEVGQRVVACRVGSADVTVAMGQASFAREDVPVACEAAEAVELPLQLDGDSFAITAVGLGNPHCVSFWEQDLDQLPWRRWGAILECHALFPRRSNVQFARVLARDRVEVRIWERGAGETLASGSSSCGVVAAGLRTGRLDRQVQVVSPGGTLQVAIDQDWRLQLRGPVQEVGEVRLAKEFVERLEQAAAPTADRPTG